METKKNEQVIYFRDLLFSVLYHWKGILITVLTAALLLGGVKGILDYQTVKFSNEDTAAAETLLMEQYQAQRESLALKVTALQDSIKSQKSYLDNSLFMRLNPYGFYKAVVHLYVDTGWQVIPELSTQSPDKTDAVLDAYLSILSGNDVLSAVASAVNTEPVYLQEVCSFTNDQTSSIVITIDSADEASAQKMAGLYIEQLMQRQAQVSKGIAEHSLRVVEQSVILQQDLTISTSQAEKADRMTQLLTDLSSAELSLNRLTVPKLTSSISVKKSFVKFAVIGGILGGFLAVFWLLVLALTNGRVFSVQSLRSRTGLKVICSVCSVPFRGVTRWLRAKEGRSTVSEAVQAPLTATYLRNCYPALTRLLLAGDMEQSHRQAFADGLRQALSGVTVSDEGSLLTEINALQALAESDVVLLLVECGTSRYQSINRETEVILDHNKPIAGCVVFNG